MEPSERRSSKSSSSRKHSTHHSSSTRPPVPELPSAYSSTSRAPPSLAPPARQRAVSAYASSSLLDSTSNASHGQAQGQVHARSHSHKVRERAGSPSSSNLYQPFPVDGGAAFPEAADVLRPRQSTHSLMSDTSRRSHRTAGGESSSRRRRESARGPAQDSASESGASVLSAFDRKGKSARKEAKEERRAKDERDQRKRATDSPLRRASRWLNQSYSQTTALWIGIGVVLVVKWATGLGEYSGLGIPPMRGDFEAQRHWLALTSSSLNFPPFHQPPAPSSTVAVPIKSWYFHDPSYWMLDYPPLTAYHSYLLGALARLSPRTAPYVTLRPLAEEGVEAIAAWEEAMVQAEAKGEMKSWLRATVVIGDLLIYVSAVVCFCWRNYGGGERGNRNAWVATMSVLLQPGLILIDNGHFQYNSIMLGFTLWAVNFFQIGWDLIGAAAFVASLGFKQMALYYSPAVFAFLLGKCFYRGPSRGLSLLVHIGLATVGSFALVFAPFVTSADVLLQALHRIFPFARGLFEDKVANVWCALNTVVKLRQIASVPALAKLALVATLLAVLPGVIGLIWVSAEAGKRRREECAQLAKSKDQPELPNVDLDTTSVGPPPTTILLPHALFASSMAFFLFSFQVHEKSILLPLMPLTLLIGGREAGYGRLDWEWAVLLNNVGTFSMWPLLKRDGLGLEYVVLGLMWNWAIGYNPLRLRHSFVKLLSIVSYAVILALHTLELVASPPAHLPDLFVVLNLTFAVAVFGLGFLWAGKRSAQEGWAVVGMR